MFFFFPRLNKNKTRYRLRLADPDVLGQFCCTPAKAVSKIYRKHLAKSTGRSRGCEKCKAGTLRVHVTGSGARGTGNGCGIPGLRRANTQLCRGLAYLAGVFHREFLSLAYLFPATCAWSVPRGPSK